MSNVPITTQLGIEARRGWPIEIRALFDPVADRELAAKIYAEKIANAPPGKQTCPHPEDYREGQNCALCGDTGYLEESELPF